MLQKNRGSYVVWLLAGFLWISWAGFAEDTNSSTHADPNRDNDTRLKVAQAQVVGARPPEPALTRIIEDLRTRPNITMENFRSMVGGVQGLNEVQKGALVSSFGYLDGQIRASGNNNSGVVGEEFRRALEGAKVELVQAPPPVVGSGDAKKNPDGTDKAAGEDPNKQNPNALLQQQLLSKLLELAGNKEGKQGGDRGGRQDDKGQQGKGGEGGGKEGGQNQDKDQNANNQKDNNQPKRDDVAKNNRGGNGGGNNNSNNNKDDKKDDEKKADENSSPGRKERKRSSSDELASSAKKKKKDDNASSLLNSGLGDDKPESGGNFFGKRNLGEKSALSPISQQAFNAPGGSGDGGGSGGLFNAPIQGGKKEANLDSGGGYVDGMRLNADYGPADPGGNSFERGGIFSDGGGVTGGDSYSNGLEEGDFAGDSEDSTPKPKIASTVPLEMMAPGHRTSASEHPSIMDYVGHFVVQTCGQTGTSVGVCSRTSEKRSSSLKTSDSTKKTENDQTI